jgi:DnaJ-domain-containing protein 1
MASDLYDALHIPPEASQEEIRKAYKKRALQTHPDRLPPNATAAEKAASEDKFRKVNNAYEILKDPQKRRVISSIYILILVACSYSIATDIRCSWRLAPTERRTAPECVPLSAFKASTTL